MGEIERRTHIVVLAAGMGTRMKSDKAKVLHELFGSPMIFYVIDTARRLDPEQITVVIGNQSNIVRQCISERYPSVRFAIQKEQLGTGHAVQCAMPFVPDSITDIVILYGDVPLLRGETLSHMIEEHDSKQNDVTLLAVEMADPTGYGRVLTNSTGDMIGIVEEADTDEHQKSIRIVNSGIYCIRKGFLEKALPLIAADNKQGEFYLTDIVGIGHGQGAKLGVMVSKNSEETLGVNTLADLKRVEKVMYSRKMNNT